MSKSLFVLYFFSYCILYSLARSTLTTSLNSGWSITPIELQFSEWIAQRGSSCFWQWVQDLFQREQHLDSDRESFEWCEEWIARRWDIASGQVAVWSVLAVEQLGSVVLQDQWASHVWYYRQPKATTTWVQEKPSVFAEWNDQLYIDLDTLIADLRSVNHSTKLKADAQPDIDIGHCYGSSRKDIPLVILYGHLGKMEMKPWHDFLFSMANKGKVCYMIRHSYLSSSHRSMYLQGYGVEVFMKNTEYWVQDPLAYPCAKVEQANHTFDISTISDQRCLLQNDDCQLGGIDWPALVDHYSLSQEDKLTLQNALDNWEQSRASFKEWKPWQVGDIGLSATHLIVHSQDPLSTFERIANNIPLYAPLLAGPWHLSDSQVLSYRQILQSLEDWEEQVTLNGRSLSLPWGLLPPTLTNCMDAITLARHVALKESITNQSILSHNMIDNHLWSASLSTPSIRLSLVHPNTPVVFIQNENDILSLLKDTKMSASSSSVVFYEYAAYLRSLDKLSSSQLVDVIFLWDPLDGNQLVVIEWMKQVLEQGWPIRMGIGLIPSSAADERDDDDDDDHRYPGSVDWKSYMEEDSTSEQQHIWYHLASHYFPSKRKMSLHDEETMTEIVLIALEYLTNQVPCPIAGYYFLAKLKQKMTVPMDIFTLLSDGGRMASYEKLQWSHLQEAFLFAYHRRFSCSLHNKEQQEDDTSTAEEIWKGWMNKAMHSSIVKRHRQWANAMGFQRLPMVIINGIPLGDIASQLIVTLEQEMKEILKQASSSRIQKWIPRQNTRLQATTPYNPSILKEILQHNEYAQFKYFKTNAAVQNSVGLATIWIAVDLESLQGLKLMALALEWLTCPLSIPGRIAFLSSTHTHHSSHISCSDQQDQIQQMKQLVITRMKKSFQGQQMLTTDDSLEFLSYVPGISDQWIQKDQVFINGFGYSSHLFTFPTDFDLACSMMDIGLSMEDADAQLLWSFTSRWLDESCSLSFSRPGSSLFSSSSSTALRMNEWKQLLGQSYDLLSFHSISSTTNETQKYTSVFHVEAILDPLSPNAAKAATMLSILRTYFDVSISVLLLPSSYTSIETIRKASFYRTVLIPRPRFEKNTGALISKPSGVFTTLFKNRTLTVSMDTPPKWLIGASHAEEDLDNLVLQNDTQVYAEYQLEAILVEGTCIDVSNLSFVPPQGLPLSLVPRTSDWMQTQDTLVMANLGYFQFQTHFGVWNLQVGQRQGISYQLKVEESKIADTTASIASSLIFGSSIPNIISQPMSSNVFLLVKQLQGKTLTLYVRPSSFSSPDKVRMQLPAIIPPTWLSKLLDKIQLFSWWSSEQQHISSNDRMVHVFSVASGYLYERLIRIMILSVVKHSSVPVKFWLLKNYLSPSFKKILPHFAAKCGFDYQLVTYRWPAWLTAQTEKQRIMWAYKILFLDVLFPLNLSKVIFVDSDQVVRGDLYELFQLDLHGAPYGYVPFCDSRKEVEGYRFWKQGFWASLLKDQRYRISALYVVDLKQFRKMAAGDNLRAIYQRLAQDPASLSNLDQDLPNFASVPQPGLPHVPIHDLPPEWLWCETWCDDESKKRAKTIDLYESYLNGMRWIKKQQK
ncbi:UDP-glucose:glycoprotein glucosyltransferase [Galdieria sulphuraria]|uniref:UDP-glucose:glycoprotein glucosyltransferase n=1 Tax=Galdieria sulphuraria TaxID=130081 RepID=M2Y9P6_GALSU|nr:UDP-glucose:glycoprotein glucosyltransferase [Galdieria sulphuraria]EME32793.1 UDP-glucose:glycoprotein glucosyltransferase [Galdieria sulphuraria]|eukprot:XP_005709313.1 UDP-glucose:glycoprotein glucosyltransferase [Galdieria sulphuraria]